MKTYSCDLDFTVKKYYSVHVKSITFIEDDSNPNQKIYKFANFNKLHIIIEFEDNIIDSNVNISAEDFNKYICYNDVKDNVDKLIRSIIPENLMLYCFDLYINSYDKFNNNFYEDGNYNYKDSKIKYDSIGQIEKITGNKSFIYINLFCEINSKNKNVIKKLDKQDFSDINLNVDKLLIDDNNIQLTIKGTDSLYLLQNEDMIALQNKNYIYFNNTYKNNMVEK